MHKLGDEILLGTPAKINAGLGMLAWQWMPSIHDVSYGAAVIIPILSALFLILSIIRLCWKWYHGE